jgi:excisionase family DNA binding protein
MYCQEACEGMADQDATTQEPIDPLTVGELITLAEAAEYAGLFKSTLHNYAKQGRLKAKKIGLYWVTTRAAVDEYLASRNLENIPKKYRERG